MKGEEGLMLGSAGRVEINGVVVRIISDERGEKNQSTRPIFLLYIPTREQSIPFPSCQQAL